MADIGVVAEGQPPFGRDPGDELRLRLHHRPVAQLALADGDLGRLGGADVAGQLDPAAVAHPVLADAQPAAVGEAELVFHIRLLPHRQPPLGEVGAHVRVVDRAAGHRIADHLLEGAPDPQRLAQAGSAWSG
jgi:hypothetical protein